MTERAKGVAAFEGETPALGALDPVSMLPASNPDGYANHEGTLLLEMEDELLQGYLTDARTGMRMVINPVPFRVGRADDCDLVLDHPTVSRRHAQVERSAGVYCVQDLDSSNGVMVNNEPVQRTLLVAGDVIRFGRVSLRFDLGAAESEPVALPGRRPRNKYLSLVTVGVLGLAIVAAGVRGFWSPTSESDSYAPAEGAPQQVGSWDWEAAFLPGSMPSVLELVALNARLPLERGVAADGAGEMDARTSDAAGSPHAAERSTVAEEVAEGRNPAPTNATPSDGTVSVAVERSAKQSAGRHPRPTAESPTATPRMQQARRAYLEGRGEAGLAMLDEVGSSGNAETDRDVDVLKRRLQTLLDLYRDGQTRFDRGDHDGAFRQWSGFLGEERKWLGGGRSAYTNTVRHRVVSAYHHLGQQAQGQQRFQDAYRLWTRAAAIDPEGKSAQALHRLQQKAQALFREGYRLEAADLSQARQRWQKVLELVPPNDEYHIKARAKLAWYERYGR